IVIFCKGAKLAVSNVALGKHGRDRTNVWSYPGANRRGSSANKALQFHPTGKSIALVADAILDVTKRGALVLDCFLGSGTTVLAAQRTGRQARGIELDPKYVDVAIRRWEEMTGQVAIHAQSGRSFAQVEQMRLAAQLPDKAA
ncbi:MAG: site-specific DNA-methyltransferase, partial [Proteobacteria bacterium]